MGSLLIRRIHLVQVSRGRSCYWGKVLILGHVLLRIILLNLSGMLEKVLHRLGASPLAYLSCSSFKLNNGSSFVNFSNIVAILCDNLSARIKSRAHRLHLIELKIWQRVSVQLMSGGHRIIYRMLLGLLIQHHLLLILSLNESHA
jgi:hypothetical protein